MLLSTQFSDTFSLFLSEFLVTTALHMEDGWIVGYLMMKYKLQWLLSVKLQGSIIASNKLERSGKAVAPSWHLPQGSEENNEILPDSVTKKIQIVPPPQKKIQVRSITA
jgi:hypothetical protein